MKEESIYVYPNVGNGNNGIDAATLAAINNGGFGGMNNPFWMMFMYPFILPFFNGMWGNNGWGANGANGAGYLANQLNNDAGRELLLQAINGRADAISQLAAMTNSSVENVRDAICTVNAKLSEIGGQVGMSGMQVINAVQSGNASLASKLAECCCENRLAIANQTNALQMTMMGNDANIRLQLATNAGEDRLAMCQQTNNISNQMDRNTRGIMDAIASQNTMLAKEFCTLKEREMESTIKTQSDLITQLRGQISNDAQTRTFTDAINVLSAKVAEIAAKQPNTVPVVYPNLVGVNTTPNATTTTTFNNGGNCGWNNNPYCYGFGVQNGFFN